MVSPLALPTLKAVIRGMQLFILFTAVAIGFTLWWKTPHIASVLRGDLDWRFAAFVIPLVVADYLLGALRFRLFFDGKVLPRISLWDCMRSNWANFFMADYTAHLLKKAFPTTG